jgi:signal transduction histidine kinase
VKEEVLERLLDISRQMAENRDLGTLLEYAMATALELVGGEYGYLILLDEEGKLDFRVRRGRDGQELEKPEAQISHTILNKVVRNCEDLIIADAASDPDYVDSDSIHDLQVRAVMCVPLVSRGKAIGALYVENRSLAGLFTEDTLLPLKYFASQAAVSIENAALNDDLEARVATRTAELREANERLGTLRKVDIELTSRLDVEYVLIIAMDAAMRLSLADDGFIGLAKGDKVQLAQVVGRYSREMLGDELSPDKGIAGRTIRKHEAEWVLDVSADPDYVALIPETRAQIAMPLLSHERLIGVLNLETHTPERFSEEVFESLKLLTVRIAVAIENAQMYEEHERLIEELDAFAHTVAHDLKNPINVIVGYGQLLSMPKLDEAKREKCLDGIKRGASRMLDIIQALLLLSSVRKTDEIAISPLDMGKIVEEALQRLAELTEERGAEVIVPASWPSATGYELWVEQVWINYISNALKYGGKPPRVELGATPEAEGKIRFWVRDNGAGLTLEEQAQLFAPFVRLHPSGEIEGHGLGLSIVQRIVEKLGGKASVTSQPGKGSVFSFTLPGVDG